MENEVVSVSLTIQKWNIILNALSKRPFEEVNELIFDVKNQADVAIRRKQALASAENTVTEE